MPGSGVSGDDIEVSSLRVGDHVDRSSLSGLDHSLATLGCQALPVLFSASEVFYLSIEQLRVTN
ncbi:MAG: hypothetical protein DHS20C08_18240 [Rhodomicrobium sp.]|nr:MAG: hypothetical protein DHS20C08_18240 [Rhodomicrobium sp.]